MRRLVYCLSAVAILAAVVSGCRKRNMPGSSSPATVEITVKDTEGKPVAGEKVMMYGYAAFSEFQKDHSVKAASEALTDIQGKAVFTLEYGRWFRDADRQDFMFVVLRSPGADNYRWWAEGGTVSSGETRRFSITVDPVPDFSDILVVEDGVLTGLKDKSVTERTKEFDMTDAASSGSFRGYACIVAAATCWSLIGAVGRLPMSAGVSPLISYNCEERIP